jgi:pimeloyl-ACP methyl ester carboxylesterase
MNNIDFKFADAAGVRIFYREAGDPELSTIVLMHGFPSSSHEFVELIPLLAEHFHVLAPDYPGMGYSEAPDPVVLRPTFDDVGRVFEAFVLATARL